jgi:hypothetical protein
MRAVTTARLKTTALPLQLYVRWQTDSAAEKEYKTKGRAQSKATQRNEATKSNATATDDRSDARNEGS